MAHSTSTIAAGLKKVPPFPPVAAKLLSLLSDPAVETNEVAKLISSDATFTARLLQRVNSVEFGLAAPVANVRQAVALLGLDLTREITLSHATAVYAKGALRTEELRRCWQHTIATAVLADEIALACAAFGNGSPVAISTKQKAFTAGIMHDIGRLGLLVAYPEEYERVIRNAAERCLDLLDFEKEEFGLDHAEAGRLLAERWNLPLEMGVIAGRHHDPCEGSELDLLRIVHVACRLADAFGYEVVKPLGPIDTEAVLAELPPSVGHRLGNARSELCARIDQQILEFGSDKASVPPEESLALLSSSATQGLEPPLDVDLSPVRQEKLSSVRIRVIVGSVLVGLVGLAALVLWLLH